MICIEIPVKTMTEEIRKLQEVEGHYAEMYAKGARDALNWLVNGGRAPSETNGFPLFRKEAA